LERTHHDGEVEEGRRREERRKGRNTKRTRKKTREIKDKEEMILFLKKGKRNVVDFRSSCWVRRRERKEMKNK